MLACGLGSRSGPTRRPGAGPGPWCRAARVDQNLVVRDGVEGDVAADEERPVTRPNLVAAAATPGFCAALLQTGIEFVEVAIGLCLAPGLEAASQISRRSASARSLTTSRRVTRESGPLPRALAS